MVNNLMNSYMASTGLPGCVLHTMQKSTIGKEKIRKMRRECVYVYRISGEAQGRKNRNNMVTGRVAES